MRDAEVIQNLPPMFVGDGIHGFEFQYDLAEAKEPKQDDAESIPYFEADSSANSSLA